MKFQNHYRMAALIHARMKRRGIVLHRFNFILGNLAPDLNGSFLVRRHEYASSGSMVKKLMLRLYRGQLDPKTPGFSYRLGIISHYVCDYFCYSHSPAFRGNLLDHLRYEGSQRVPGEETFSLYRTQDPAADFAALAGALEGHIFNHDERLRQNAALAKSGISLGMAASEWLLEELIYAARRSPAVPAQDGLAEAV